MQAVFFEKMIALGCLLLQVALAQDELPLPSRPFPVKAEEVNPKFWEEFARQQIDRANKQFPQWALRTRRVRNVILFLGDGMGLPTVAASRFHKNERNGKPVQHIFEEWDFSTPVRTYDLESVITDSAASATAYLTGTKTRTSMIGVTGAVQFMQCTNYTAEERTESALTAAQKIGKRTAIVTTSRVTHASPAGCYGNVGSRDFECDVDIECTGPCGCKDLALQLVEEHPDINVILGGGQANFYPEGVELPANKSEKGRRKDKRDLAQEWINYQKNKGRAYKYVESWESFTNTRFGDFDYVLGLPEVSHFPYDLDRRRGFPSLTEMALAALKVLKKSPNGFFLFVEGALIDRAHHENHALKSFEELTVFENTIKAVISAIDLTNTLVIVTADHSHSFELTGQQSRFLSLFLPDIGKGPEVLDTKGMQPLNYVSGPGAKINETRGNITAMEPETLLDKETMQQALIPLQSAAHGGDDVGLYVRGPFSYLFHATIDNTFIAQAMKYAMCAAPFDKEPICDSCAVKSSLVAAFIIVVWGLYN